MLNWINFSVEGAEPIIDELQNRLGQFLSANETLTLRTTEKGSMLFVESFQEEAIVSEVETVSRKYPDESIGIRYAASIPGSYHVITGTYKAGQIGSVQEETELFLE